MIWAQSLIVIAKNFKYCARIIKDGWRSFKGFWSLIFSGLWYKKVSSAIPLKIKYSRIEKFEAEDFLFIEIKTSFFSIWFHIEMFIRKNLWTSDFLRIRVLVDLGPSSKRIETQIRKIIFTSNSSDFPKEPCN